jgi:hypothetical protein
MARPTGFEPVTSAFGGHVSVSADRPMPTIAEGSAISGWKPRAAPQTEESTSPSNSSEALDGPNPNVRIQRSGRTSS